MSAYQKVQNKLVTCPYDEAHRMKQSRLQLHIAKCKLNHLDKDMEVCPFNATHRFGRSERDYHLLNCPDKGVLDRKLAQSVDKNNPYKGRTDVPSYSEAPEVLPEESWDEEISNGTPGYIPRGPPVGGLVEPRPMAKPAERRKLYQELHRKPGDVENNKEPSVVKPSPVPRQPKQPSETLKMQSAKMQQLNMQETQNLGLGRGKPATRIAANIFDQSNNVNNLSHSDSEVINGINNLGLGRGQSVTQAFPAVDYDDDFPTLGCGRGVFNAPKRSPRAPGDKPFK